MSRWEVIIKSTHRGLWYEDGVLTRILEAGRHRIPRYFNLGFYRRPRVEVVLVDVRERDLTIKGQEILTGDKVAIRVSIVVQFRVTDPRAAVHQVASYEDRIYGDVQLAARRSLATMNLDEILTNRNRLSEDILHEVQGTAEGYGVSIIRADVKDLVFPGNLQEIMNRVLAAERNSQAELVQTRAAVEKGRLEAQARSEVRLLEAEAEGEVKQRLAASAAEALRVQTAAETAAVVARERAAAAYARHPALLRLRELEALCELALNANARIYIGFDKYGPLGGRESRDDDAPPRPSDPASA